MKKGLGFILGLVTGAALALLFLDKEPPRLSAFPIFERQSYMVAYDTRAKIPFWTYEYLTPENLQKNIERRAINFQEDPSIYLPHRSRTSDYSHSGFDRGHLVPAGDASFSRQALQETFLLSNICPQHPSLNRGLWALLEKKIRLLVKEGKPVEVMTGPLFIPHDASDGKRYVTYQVIGKSDIAVPTHFFKVIRTPGKVEAYVLPNDLVSGKLEEYLFPIKDLEKISGMPLSLFFKQRFTQSSL